jgi:signal peptidase
MNEYMPPEVQALKHEIGLIPAGDIEFLYKLSDAKSGSVFFCGHVGYSMNTILHEIDLLEIVPYRDRAIRAGDVVIFLHPEGSHCITHRVVSITPEGISTRGDNNYGVDPWLLQPADVAGQVVAAQRRQKRRKIAGGTAGQLLAHIIHTRRYLNRSVTRLLSPAYQLLVRHGTVRRLLPSRFKPSVIASRTGDRLYLRLLMGRRIVGTYNSNLRQWDINRPFRLFVDESSLPGTQEIEADQRTPN